MRRMSRRIAGNTYWSTAMSKKKSSKSEHTPSAAEAATSDQAAASAPDVASAEAEAAPTNKKAKTPKQSKAPKPAKPKKMSCLNAAAQVLADAGTPMTTGEMIEAMSKAKLWSSPNGQTPAATLYSAILREI